MSGTADSAVYEVDATDGDSLVEDDGEVYQVVTVDGFAEYADLVVSRVDGLVASSVVLVFALFMCAAILAVDTLIRSLERF